MEREVDHFDDAEPSRPFVGHGPRREVLITDASEHFFASGQERLGAGDAVKVCVLLADKLYVACCPCFAQRHRVDAERSRILEKGDLDFAEKAGDNYGKAMEAIGL